MKIEVFAFIAGIIVFFSLLGSFYFLMDNKSFSNNKTLLTPTPSQDKLKVFGPSDTVKNVPPKDSMAQQQAAQQQQPPKEPKTEVKGTKNTAPEMTIDKTKKYTAVLETTEGEITIVLNSEKAPQTVNNFVHLAKTDYYDNVNFHRVMKDFMIQTGDPKGDGTGGPGYTIPAEISDDLKHVRGAVSTARLGDAANPTKASSGSQFFIIHKETPQLDGDYTVFGMVTDGLDVVDAIAESEVSESASGEKSKPVTPVKITNVRITQE